MHDLGHNYVAFIDLVAFKAIVEVDEYRIQTAISETLGDVRGRTDLLNRALGRGSVYRSQLNGDAIVVSLEKESSSPSDVLDLLDIVRGVQTRLFNRFGLLVRGGISCGRLCQHDEYFTGSGMSRASSVLEEENPSFLIAVDDSIAS